MRDVHKPWGNYTDIIRTKSLVVKRIFINPGEELSYQYHNNRNEIWYIEEGYGQMVVDDYTWHVKEGAVIHIEKKQRHTVRNIGSSKLIIYETQYGDCSESDIVRLTDKYNR